MKKRISHILLNLASVMVIVYAAWCISRWYSDYGYGYNKGYENGYKKGYQYAVDNAVKEHLEARDKLRDALIDVLKCKVELQGGEVK